MTEALSAPVYNIRFDGDECRTEGFTDYLRTRNYSDNTIRLYMYGVNRVLGKISETKGLIPIENITLEDLVQARDELEKELGKGNVRYSVRSTCDYIHHLTGNDFFNDIYAKKPDRYRIEGRYGTVGRDEDAPQYSLYEPMVENFLRSLKNRYSETTVNRHRKGIRKFLNTMIVTQGYTPVNRIDLEMVRRTNEILSHTYVPRICQDFTKYVCRFIESETGHDYYGELYGLRNDTRWQVGKMGAFLFRAELDEYCSKLVSEGYDSADKICNGIRTICQVLEKGKNIRSLVQIDDAIIDWLDDEMEMSCGKLKKNKMGDFGRFVGYVTGTDPVKMREERNRNSERFDTESPEGKDFLAKLDNYCTWMEKRNAKPISVKSEKARAIGYYAKIFALFGPMYVKDIGFDHLCAVAPMDWGISINTLQGEASTFGRVQLHTCGFNSVKDASYIWPIREKKRPFIHAQELDAMLKIADEMETLILALGSTMGLRRAEIANLLMSDIKGDMLTIRGKGHGPCGHEVTMALSDDVIDALSRYLPIRKKILEENGDRSEGHILVNSVMFPGMPIKHHTISLIVKDLADRAGVVATTHSLRRLFCNAMKQSGMNLEDIRINMRHANSKTTEECYIECDPETRRAGVNTASNYLRRQRTMLAMTC